MKNGIPIPDPPEHVIICKPLTWGVLRADLIRMGADGRMKVKSVSIVCPPCQEENCYAPAEGVYLNDGESAFQAMQELVDEIRSIRVDDALISQKS